MSKKKFKSSNAENNIFDLLNKKVTKRQNDAGLSVGGSLRAPFGCKPSLICSFTSVGHCGVNDVFSMVERIKTTSKLICSFTSVGHCGVNDVFSMVERIKTTSKLICSFTSVGRCTLLLPTSFWNDIFWHFVIKKKHTVICDLTFRKFLFNFFFNIS